MIEPNTTGSVLGIDVGYSVQRKSSAVCRLDWAENHISWNIERFRAIENERLKTLCRVAGNEMLQAVALDGPIRRGFDVINQYRAADQMLTRRLQPKIGKPGQCNVPVGRN